ncbi:hypothetical protein D3C72_1216370 [compost metagenome]
MDGLALDLPDQRAARPARTRSDSVRAPQVAMLNRRRGLVWGDQRDRGAGQSRLRHCHDRSGGLQRPADSDDAGFGRPLRRLRGRTTRPTRAASSSWHLQSAQPGRGQSCDGAARSRLDPALVLPQPLPSADPWPLGSGQRPGAPAHDRHAHDRDGGLLGQTHRTVWRQDQPRARAPADGGSASDIREIAVGRLIPDQRTAGLPPRRPGHGPGLYSGDDGRHGRRQA